MRLLWNMQKNKKRVVVGLSGGVDSAVAAHLLKKEGHEVIGIFMKNWEDEISDSQNCPSRKDFIDAASVADIIKIDIEVVNFAEEYQQRVFKDFLREYAVGRTPNPDVFCNSEIKFKVFLDHALNIGGDSIATGHYAKIKKINDYFQLLKAEDGNKDQSYFLHRLSQNQLARSLFPLGGMYKRDVRNLAKEIGLPNYDKKDSTGICFIGERPFREFLGQHLPDKPGDIYSSSGEYIGRHRGLMYYTIGQRHGLGIGGAGDPWYVVNKNVSNNQLIIAQGHDNKDLLSNALVAQKAHWISGQKPRTKWVYSAKTRYRQTEAPCTIEDIDEDKFEIRFAEPQWAITPGQSVVVYESNVCIGGGLIESPINYS